MQTLEDTSTETACTGADAPAHRNVINSDQFASAYISGRLRTERFLISRQITPDLAEEIAQAAWTRAWERRVTLQEPDKVLKWVNSIALNLFRREFRRRRVVMPLLEVPVAPGTGPRDVDLQRILGKCNREDRDLLEKSYAEGYTSTELGLQLRCSPVSVRVRLMRLRRRIEMR